MWPVGLFFITYGLTRDTQIHEFVYLWFDRCHTQAHTLINFDACTKNSITKYTHIDTLSQGSYIHNKKTHIAVMLFRITFQCGGSGLGPLGRGILNPKPSATQTYSHTHKLPQETKICTRKLYCKQKRCKRHPMYGHDRTSFCWHNTLDVGITLLLYCYTCWSQRFVFLSYIVRLTHLSGEVESVVCWFSLCRPQVAQ